MRKKFSVGRLCSSKSLLGISAHGRKIFHVSTKDLRICAKNPTNDYYKKLK